MQRQDEYRIGLIICDRYHHCAGGKCFRALREREGALSRILHTWDASFWQEVTRYVMTDEGIRRAYD